MKDFFTDVSYNPPLMTKTNLTKGKKGKRSSIQKNFDPQGLTKETTKRMTKKMTRPIKTKLTTVFCASKKMVTPGLFLPPKRELDKDL